MSKSMIESYVKGQYLALGAKDNKERLGYIIAGCKDGKLYSYDGTDYGMFNVDAPDTVFIAESDLELSRITGVKIANITKLMDDFFAKYGDNPVESSNDDMENSETPVESVESTPKKEKKIKSDDVEAPAPVEDEIDTEAVTTAVKKAIKKGDFKKAQKLIDKLGGDKKLQKKLDKAQ